MRARLAIILASLLLLAGGTVFLAVPAGASEGLVLAQEVGEEEGDANPEQGEGAPGEGSEGAGQSDAEAESGVGEGESGGEAAEPGPPWTYQMARMAIGLVLLMFLMVGFTYYHFVYRRQKGTA